MRSDVIPSFRLRCAKERAAYHVQSRVLLNLTLRK